MLRIGANDSDVVADRHRPYAAAATGHRQRRRWRDDHARDLRPRPVFDRRGDAVVVGDDVAVPVPDDAGANALVLLAAAAQQPGKDDAHHAAIGGVKHLLDGGRTCDAAPTHEGQRKQESATPAVSENHLLPALRLQSSTASVEEHAGAA